MTGTYKANPIQPTRYPHDLDRAHAQVPLGPPALDPGSSDPLRQSIGPNTSAIVEHFQLPKPHPEQAYRNHSRIGHGNSTGRPPARSETLSIPQRVTHELDAPTFVNPNNSWRLAPTQIYPFTTAQIRDSKRHVERTGAHGDLTASLLGGRHYFGGMSNYKCSATTDALDMEVQANSFYGDSATSIPGIEGASVTPPGLHRTFHTSETLSLKERKTLRGTADNVQAITPVFSIVVPVYNEKDVLREFHRRLTLALFDLGAPSEIAYVNDGSTDGSLDILHDIRDTDPRVALINLSRNFGKEIAVTAGLDHAQGEFVVVIDADLQDPPEIIPRLVEKSREGYDMVYAKRRERRGETFLKRATASLFYRLIRRISDTPIPDNTGDFRILNKRCLQALQRCGERRRFMKGLFAWVGFKHSHIVYDRDPRFAGKTKWNYWRLWNLALEGVTSCTIVPLKLASYLGALSAGGAMTYGLFILARTLILGREVAGYASLMVTMLFVSGVQLIALGVIGEYVGRIFVETKARPLYFLDAFFPSRASAPED